MSITTTTHIATYNAAYSVGLPVLEVVCSVAPRSFVRTIEGALANRERRATAPEAYNVTRDGRAIGVDRYDLVSDARCIAAAALAA